MALGSLGIVMTSPDGLSWTQQPSLPVNNFNDLIFNGTMFVGVGHTVNNGVFVTSTDGINWTIQNTPLPVMAVSCERLAARGGGSVGVDPDQPGRGHMDAAGLGRHRAPRRGDLDRGFWRRGNVRSGGVRQPRHDPDQHRAA